MMNKRILTAIFTVVVCVLSFMASADERYYDITAEAFIRTGNLGEIRIFRENLMRDLGSRIGTKQMDASAMYCAAEYLLMEAKDIVSSCPEGMGGIKVKNGAIERLCGGRLWGKEKAKGKEKTNGYGAYNMAVAIVLYCPDSPYSLAAFELTEEIVKFAEKKCGEKLPSLTSLGYPAKLGDTSKKPSRPKRIFGHSHISWEGF